MGSNEYTDNTQIVGINPTDDTVVYPSYSQERNFFTDKTRIIILLLSVSFAVILTIIILFVILAPKKFDITSSVPESLSLYEESYSQMRNGEATYQDICNRFESIIESVNEIGKFHYSIYYAKIIYDVEGDINKATDQIKIYEAIVNTDNRLLDEYYAALSDLYTEEGDVEQAEYYNQKLKEIAPSDVIDIMENN